MQSNEGPFIPKTAADQNKTLARMFGGSPAHSAPPPRIGASVFFDVSWNCQLTKRRRTKLTDDQLADYERARADAAPFVGQHFRHFDHGFDAWTAADIDRLLADMYSTLLATPVRPIRVPYLDDWHVRYYRYSERVHGHDTFELCVSGGQRDYGARVALPVSVPMSACLGSLVRLNLFRFDFDSTPKGAISVAAANISKTCMSVLFDQPWRDG